MERLNWDDVRLFLSLAREGTLTGAARQLGVGVATMSRRIERLEAAMAVPLFLRHQQGLDLTDQGQALLPRAEAVELAMSGLRRDAEAQAEIHGLVRLACVETLIEPIILPALAPLLAANPGLDVEVSYAPNTVNLHRHDADLALRMVAPEAGNLVVRRVGTMGFGLYGPPDGSRPARRVSWPDLEAFAQLRGWSRAFPATSRIILNSLSAQTAAIGEGIGTAILPHFLARSAGLTLLEDRLPDGGPMERRIWLVQHADLSASRRVRAVAEAVTDAMVTARHDLSGDRASYSGP